MFVHVPVVALSRALVFPPPEHAVEGLVAVGGDLVSRASSPRVSVGNFPVVRGRLPILWHSPDPRCVIPIEKLHIGRTLRRVIARGTYAVRYDTAFASVIRACKSIPRHDQDGTWITDDVEKAYVRLHDDGLRALGRGMVGRRACRGLYGVSLGRMFFGESMFALQPNASKVALVTLAERLARWGFRIIDAQVPTPHTVAMGAEDWPRKKFLEVLREALAHPTRRGSWAVEEPPLEA